MNIQRHNQVVANTLRELIQEKGMKQKAVAQKAGLSEWDLSAILHGRKLILADHIVGLAQALEVDPNRLFGYETGGIKQE
ncbi:MAG: helix-turn-helix domain-containing protein [Massiliimalia sp.]|jgi:transcriptional regulator with XRE-family HTH domain